MKKGIAVLLSLVLVGGVGAGIYYFRFRDGGAVSGGERVSSDSENAVYVDSVSMLAGLGSGNGLIQRYAGVVEPQQTWDVKLENDRKVKECYVKEGDEVKVGQKLFTYDTTEDEDKLAQTQIDLERCQNDIATSKANKEQYEREKKNASADNQLAIATQIMQEETAIKMAEYDYKTKELEIQTLKDRIADSTVNCEIDGVVKSIKDPNDNSSSYGYMSDSGSDAAYITVLEVGDYRVKGTVNEQNINQITEGMEMIVHSRVDDTMTWRGTITEINRDKGETNSDSYSYGFGASDSSTSSTNYPFYVELDASDNMILGQHVYMEQNQGQEDKKDGIWLDDYYFVIEEDGTAYAWAASAGNTLEKRKVTLGEYDEELAAYEVLDGLNEEDYITVPSEELTEGLPVIYNDVSYGDGMGGDMPMDGDMSMGGDLSMDGDMSMGGDMSMDGDMSMGGDLSMDGDMSMGGNMPMNGDMYMDQGMDMSVDGEDYGGDMMDGGVYDESMMDGTFYDENAQDGEVYDADADMADASDMEEMDGLDGEVYAEDKESNE